MPTEGQTAINKNTGQTAVYRGGQWVQDKVLPADANMRSRLDIGMAPMVQSNQTMMDMEKDGNPLNKHIGAAILNGIGFSMGKNDFHPLRPVAKMVGGQDFQNYQQAASGFESQLMPIMSGAAVSPSEAQRQVGAALPELGDSTETLAAKARLRQMMLNGAAKAKGAALPYPQLPTYGVNTNALPASTNRAAPQAMSPDIPILSPDQAAKAPPGTRFRTPDGRTLVRK